MTFDELVELIQSGIDDTSEAVKYPDMFWANDFTVDGDREPMVQYIALRVWAALAHDDDWPMGDYP